MILVAIEYGNLIPLHLTAAPQTIPDDIDRKHLAETVSRRDTVFDGGTQSMPLIFA